MDPLFLSDLEESIVMDKNTFYNNKYLSIPSRKGDEKLRYSYAGYCKRLLLISAQVSLYIDSIWLALMCI